MGEPYHAAVAEGRPTDWMMRNSCTPMPEPEPVAWGQLTFGWA